MVLVHATAISLYRWYWYTPQPSRYTDGTGTRHSHLAIQMVLVHATAISLYRWYWYTPQPSRYTDGTGTRHSHLATQMPFRMKDGLYRNESLFINKPRVGTDLPAVSRRPTPRCSVLLGRTL
ncbi:hypothetical protein RRG08_015634 [Elysia crispata]|uniref:Uncharacterized protein n=1 Tax=Elysia crispata TaxID=231223 RepID=A0AAE1CTP2_9GAST|nr:hypothetical protein RRG08_015634 [Elysia crispata]